MAKSIFQRAKDRILAWQTPIWLKSLLRVIEILLRRGLKTLAEVEVAYLRNMVIIQGTKEGISGPDKLQNVINGFRQRYTTSRITTSMLTAFICGLVEIAKESKDIV